MKNYHVVIETDQRAGTDRCATSPVSQLHSMGESVTNLANPNLLYVAEWDGVSDHVTVLKGSMTGRDMAYAGWPMTDAPMQSSIPTTTLTKTNGLP